MKILVVEDEPAAAKRLVKMIKECEGEQKYEIVGQLDSVQAVIDWWKNHDPPELLFLDIHLADGSSFEIFNEIKVEQPIIFTTAYDEYALKAFQVNAIDYLLKPIKSHELEQAILKYKATHSPAKINYTELVNLLAPDKMTKRFMIKIGQQIQIIDLQDVAYFYTQDKITFLMDKNGKRYPIDESLEKLEEIVKRIPNTFFRINRQFIVSLGSIEKMYAYSKSRVKLSLNPSCKLETIVSTERSPIFKKWLVGDVG